MSALEANTSSTAGRLRETKSALDVVRLRSPQQKRGRVSPKVPRGWAEGRWGWETHAGLGNAGSDAADEALVAAQASKVVLAAVGAARCLTDALEDASRLGRDERSSSAEEGGEGEGGAHIDRRGKRVRRKRKKGERESGSGREAELDERRKWGESAVCGPDARLTHLMSISVRAVTGDPCAVLFLFSPLSCSSRSSHRCVTTPGGAYFSSCGL